jgi:hypothetical protein
MQHSLAGLHGRRQPAPRLAKETAGSHGLQAPTMMSRGTGHPAAAIPMRRPRLPCPSRHPGWIDQAWLANNGNLAAAAQQAHGNPNRSENIPRCFVHSVVDPRVGVRARRVQLAWLLVHLPGARIELKGNRSRRCPAKPMATNPVRGRRAIKDGVTFFVYLSDE